MLSRGWLLATGGQLRACQHGFRGDAGGHGAHRVLAVVLQTLRSYWLQLCQSVRGRCLTGVDMLLSMSVSAAEHLHHDRVAS